MTDLVSKYNVQAPRYTSYPTVPYWDNNLNEQTWTEHIKKSFIQHNKDGISLYIHLPFCESLCTYCACNTRITVNHSVELPYIQTLLKEWQLYLNQFNSRPLIKEIHLGGGTPTFFSYENLNFLLSHIINTCDVSKDADFSFEGHPGNTTKEHLQTLFNLGFKRVSFGVQDFDEKVQKTINRYQTFEEVKYVMETARAIGYTSINIDLVYGLPYQTSDSVTSTIEQIITLKPERIAFYSYAHVPWLKPGQRKYTEKDLPLAAEKRNLYEIGKELFIRANYTDVGMDHFALPGDELLTAFHNGTLHRNFMGYTTNKTKLLIGLGCSSISDTWHAFAQNIKTVEEYSAVVNEGRFPVQKGHVLSHEDLLIRQHILNLMCRHESDFDTTLCNQFILKESMHKLKELVSDHLINIRNNKVILSEQGKLFLRNICLAFDKRYWSKQPGTNIFSTTA
ncbi:MAG: coproporphyrinogen oxidase [Bacteroidota bacterium]|jgi:oxygen-independent coproporphyrinogen-3 oxidase|nr:coproporphyrinogen oxidase [Bacteroidota bacterium]